VQASAPEPALANSRANCDSHRTFLVHGNHFSRPEPGLESHQANTPSETMAKSPCH